VSPARGRFVGPNVPSPHTDWAQVARLARRGVPGHWYQVTGRLYGRAVAQHVRSGRIAAFRPAGSWEARYVPTDDPNQFALYIRPTTH
jgi:hypothetical protein